MIVLVVTGAIRMTTAILRLSRAPPVPRMLWVNPTGSRRGGLSECLGPAVLFTIFEYVHLKLFVPNPAPRRSPIYGTTSEGDERETL